MFSGSSSAGRGTVHETLPRAPPSPCRALSDSQSLSQRLLFKAEFIELLVPPAHDTFTLSSSGSKVPSVPATLTSVGRYSSKCPRELPQPVCSGDLQGKEKPWADSGWGAGQSWAGWFGSELLDVHRRPLALLQVPRLAAESLVKANILQLGGAHCTGPV